MNILRFVKLIQPSQMAYSVANEMAVKLSETQIKISKLRIRFANTLYFPIFHSMYGYSMHPAVRTSKF